MPRDYRLLKFFADLVAIAFCTVTRHHFTDESGKEELEAKENSDERKIEQRLLCYRPINQSIGLLDEFLYNNPYSKYGSGKEHQDTCETEEVHWLFAEFA